MYTYRIVELYRQHGSYIVLNSIKKNLFSEEDKHIMFPVSPISRYCYDLVNTLSVSGKCFNAVSLAVPST